MIPIYVLDVGQQTDVTHTITGVYIARYLTGIPIKIKGDNNTYTCSAVDPINCSFTIVIAAEKIPTVRGKKIAQWKRERNARKYT